MRQILRQKSSNIRKTVNYVKRCAGFVNTLTEEELINLFYFKFQNAPLLTRMDAIRDYCVDEYETLLGRDLSEEELSDRAE